MRATGQHAAQCLASPLTLARVRAAGEEAGDAEDLAALVDLNLRVAPQDVVGVVRQFVEDRDRERAEDLGAAARTKSRLSDMHARRNRLARMEQEYWGELASPLPPATARVWTALEGAMQRYTGVLKDRANLVEEVGSLQHVRRRRCPATPAVVCPPLTRARWAGLGCEVVAGKRRAAGAAEPVLGRSRQRGAILPAHAGNSCAQDVGPTHASNPASHSLYCSLLQALRTGRRLFLSLVSFPKRNATPLF